MVTMKKILLVEDDDTLRKTLGVQSSLRKDTNVLQTGDGAEALDPGSRSIHPT